MQINIPGNSHKGDFGIRQLTAAIINDATTILTIDFVGAYVSVSLNTK